MQAVSIKDFQIKKGKSPFVRDNLVGATSGNAPAGFQYIIHKKNARQLMFEGYSLIKLSNHRLAFSVSSNSGVQTTIVDNNQAVEVGKYYHAAGTYDGTTARIYVNGQKVAEAVHGRLLELTTEQMKCEAKGRRII